MRCSGQRVGGTITHTWGTGQCSGEEVVCEQQDIWQRQPDVRRLGWEGTRHVLETLIVQKRWEQRVVGWTRSGEKTS